jgi:hypothetical protein
LARGVIKFAPVALYSTESLSSSSCPEPSSNGRFAGNEMGIDGVVAFSPLIASRCESKFLPSIITHSRTRSWESNWIRTLRVAHTRSPPPVPMVPPPTYHFEDCHLPQKKRSLVPVSIASSVFLTSLRGVIPAFRKPKSRC